MSCRAWGLKESDTTERPTLLLCWFLACDLGQAIQPPLPPYLICKLGIRIRAPTDYCWEDQVSQFARRASWGRCGVRAASGGGGSSHLSFLSRMRPPAHPHPLTLTPGSLSPGLCQNQAGGRRCVLLAGKESQSEREEAEMLAWRGCCFFFFFRFPSHAPRGGRFAAGVGGSGRAPKTDNRSRSLVGRGSGPLLSPSASAAACAIRLCQPSAAQASGLRSQAKPAPARLGVGLGCRAGSRKGSTALFYFSLAPLCPRSVIFPSPGALTLPAASLWLSRLSLHLCCHLPRVSCQLPAQEASGPVSLSSCMYPSLPPG